MTRLFSKTILACGAVALLVSSAHAAGTPEQRRACRKDAMTLCRQYVPNVKKITACMEAKKVRLSPLCRAQFN